MTFIRFLSEPVPQSSIASNTVEHAKWISEFYKGFSSLDSLPDYAGDDQAIGSCDDLRIQKPVGKRVTANLNSEAIDNSNAFKRFISEPAGMCLSNKGNVHDVSFKACLLDCDADDAVARWLDELNVERLADAHAWFNRSVSAPSEDIRNNYNELKRFATEPALPPLNETSDIEHAIVSFGSPWRNSRTVGSMSYSTRDDSIGAVMSAESLESYTAEMGQQLLDEFEAFIQEAADADFDTWFQGMIEFDAIGPGLAGRAGEDSDTDAGSALSTCSTRATLDRQQSFF